MTQDQIKSQIKLDKHANKNKPKEEETIRSGESVDLTDLWRQSIKTTKFKNKSE